MQEALACKQKEKEAIGIEEDAVNYGIKMHETASNPESNEMEEGTRIGKGARQTVEE
jgi:hypothetical protein